MNYLSFSIGGTYFDYGIVNQNGTVLTYHSQQLSRQQNAQSIMEQLFTVIDQVLIVETIQGIAIATVGQVDSDKGIILYASDIISDYGGLNVKKILEQKYQIPVEIENNVNCCGLAESWTGKARTLSNIYMLSIGNGIGGCSVIQHQIEKGRDFNAGEIGYIKFDEKPLSEYLQFPQLFRQVAQYRQLAPATMNLGKIFELIQAGDWEVEQLLQNFIRYIAKSVAIVCYVVNPEAVFIGGIPKVYMAYFSTVLKEKLKQELTPYMQARVDVVFTPNIEKLRLIGAVKHFLQQQKNRTNISLLEIINQSEKSFSKTDEKIAKYIGKNIADLSTMTINELAQSIGISNPSITRFCQKIGLKSYQQLRVLAIETGKYSNEKVSYLPATLLQLRKKYQHLLANFETAYDIEQFRKMAEELKKAQNIVLVGEERSLSFLYRLSEVLNRKNYLTSILIITEEVSFELLREHSYVIGFITPKVQLFFRDHFAALQRALGGCTGTFFTTDTIRYDVFNFLEIQLPSENVKDSNRLFTQQYLLDIFMDI